VKSADGRPREPVALVGFMGSGKTAIGKALSARLGLEFVDLDERIEASAGATIPSLFLTLGEPGFRRLENSLLIRISETSAPFVLSCGGGAVVLETNRLLLKERFLSVWIDVPEDELFRRLESDKGTRPLLGTGDRKARIHELMGTRAPLYAQAARFSYAWRLGEGPEDSAGRVAEILGLSSPRLSETR
jgi:shikimate kinase